MKKKTIIAQTSKSNIPILICDDHTQIANGVITFQLKDTTMGIFAPFNGVFLLKFDCAIPTAESRVTIKIENIYGEEQTLYVDKTNTATFADISTGVYLCYFDTDERRLYLVQ